jgi:hypothetical protein
MGTRLTILWTDHTEYRRCQQYPVIFRSTEYNAASSHQQRSTAKNQLPSQPIRKKRQGETEYISYECQAHKESNLGIGDGDGIEVENEDYSRAAEGEETHKALQDYDFGVEGGVVERYESEFVQDFVRHGRRRWRILRWHVG